MLSLYLYVVVGQFELLSSQDHLMSSLTDICAKPISRALLLTRLVKLLEFSHLLKSVKARPVSSPSDMPAFTPAAAAGQKLTSLDTLDSVGELSPVGGKGAADRSVRNLRDTLQSMASDRTVIVRTSISSDDRDSKSHDSDGAELDSATVEHKSHERRRDNETDEKTLDHSRSLSPLPTIPATHTSIQPPVSELNLNRPPSTRSDSLSKSYDHERSPGGASMSLDLPRPSFPHAFSRSLPAPDSLHAAPSEHFLLSAAYGTRSGQPSASASNRYSSNPPSPHQAPLKRAKSTAPSPTHPSRSTLHRRGGRSTLRSRSPSSRPRIFPYKTLNPSNMMKSQSVSLSSDSEFPLSHFRRRGSLGLVLSQRQGGTMRRRASFSARLMMHRSSVDLQAQQLTATPLDQVLGDLKDMIKDPANKSCRSLFCSMFFFF